MIGFRNAECRWRVSVVATIGSNISVEGVAHSAKSRRGETTGVRFMHRDSLPSHRKDPSRNVERIIKVDTMHEINIHLFYHNLHDITLRHFMR